MTRLMARWLVACICWCLVGCVLPYHYTDQPGVSGTVVDASTRRPLAGATVKVGETSRVSAADGSFVLAPRKHWGVYIVPADLFGEECLLTVRRGGYANYTHQIVFSRKGDFPEEKLTVPLAPLRR